MDAENSTIKPEDVELLRDELTRTAKARDRAQYVILGTQLVLCVFFVLGMWRSFSGFIDRGLVPTTNVLAEYLQKSSGRYLDQMNAATKRVVPKLAAAMSNEFTMMLPALERRAAEERGHVIRALHAQMPAIERELNKLAIEHSKIVEQEFGMKVGPERARRIADAYKTALPAQTAELGEKLFGRHARQLNHLRASARQLASKESDLVSPADPVEALGLSLELAGLQLQEEAATAEWTPVVAKAGR